MKKCKECLEEKDLSAFDKISKNGYRGTCRKCRNKKNTSSYLQKEGNREKLKEYMRVYMRNKYHNTDDYKRYNSLCKKIRYRLKSDSDFRLLFEQKFDEHMNWENQGTYWEIDHIISALKMIRNGYSDDEINDIRNIRPLKIVDNRSMFKKNTNEYSEYKTTQSARDRKNNYNKKYLEKNKEYFQKKKKEWYEKNKLKIAEKYRNSKKPKEN